MIRKILIANRGEIACRVIKTAHEMGVETVAIFSDPDRNARHVGMASEAISIGGDSAQSSYLDHDKIINAAKSSGAEAIHPGYGFLSENPDFVDRAEQEGLIFIGPSSDAIRAMGLKDHAKTLMADAGVPVVPGYNGGDQSPETLAKYAKEIGYPVMIKARAGGGGKGMRRVDTHADFEESLAATKREAQSSFGDDHVLIEKCIDNPRHIEVQVFADRFGNTVHLFERDCTLQRRHQKVIEEAPAPGMNEETRKAMTDAAVKAAKAIQYRGAGTVEFIVDGSNGLRPDGFWFMEMNTRLQVEHPVTEMVTGYDLVEWQIRVASGESLPQAQDAISLNGHAMEARIYAEDAASGFLPAPGPIHHVQFPSDIRIDPRIDPRIDHGVNNQDQVSPFYDPMIAKIICKGVDRDDALKKLYQSLGQTRIHGTTTNTGFLQNLISHDDIKSMAIDTVWIDRHLDALNTPSDLEHLAIAALTHAAADGAFGGNDGWRIWGAGQIMPKFEFEQDSHQFTLTLNKNTITAENANGEKVSFDQVKRDAKTPSQLTIIKDGKKQIVTWHDAAGQISFDVDGKAGRINRIDGRTGQNLADGGNTITAPMTGVIRTLEVAAGDAVKQGDVLVRMEAMKMEHALTAPCDGVINQINCAIGETVSDGLMLIDIEQSEQ